MFRLLRVRLENFRNFRKADLPVPDGITVVTGLNGRGKSTLFEEAPEWALFNKVKAGTTLVSIRCRHAAPDATVRVIVDFELDGHRYSVERVLTNRNSTNATLYLEGRVEPLASGTKGVNEHIVRLFGFGAQVFTTSFIARQKELDALSDFKPEERMKFFAKFAGVEALDKAKPQIRKDASTARTTAEALRGQLPSSDDAVEALQEEQRRVKELEREGKDAKVLLDRADKRLATARAAVTHMEGVQSQYLTLSGESRGNKDNLLRMEGDLLDLRGVVEGLEAELVGYVPVDDIEGEIEGLEREREAYRLDAQYGDALREAKLNARAREKDIAGKEKEAASLEERAAALSTGSVADIEARLAAAREAEAEARGNRVSSEARVRELKGFVASVAGGDVAQCPTCYTDFTGDAGEALDHVRGELAKFEDDLDSLRSRETAATSVREATETELAAARGNERERELLATKAAAARSEADGLRPSLVREREREAEATAQLSLVSLEGAHYPSLHQTETVLEKLKSQRQHDTLMRGKAADLARHRGELLRAEGQMEELEKERKSLVRRIAALKFDASQFAGLKADVETAETERREAAEVQADLDKRHALTEHTIATLKDDIARTESLKEKIALFSHNAEVGSVIDSVISLLRDDLAKRIAPRIAEQASRLLRDMTDGVYQNVLLDDAYRVTVLRESGEEWPLAQFSGGEQDVVNLCLRLGISQVILEARGLPSSLLILDEVFGSQDDERQLAIMDAIGRLKASFPQILLITHIPDVKERADHIVAVETDAAGVSQVRLVA